MYVNLETERLRLRPIDLTDAPFMLDLVNSQGWLEFIGDRKVANENDASRYIQKMLDSPEYYYNLFEDKHTRQPLGIVTFLMRANQQFPDLGFAILPEYGKNGYTLEASRAYLHHILTSGAYPNIIAITIPQNQSSISLLRKLGFSYRHPFQDGQHTLSLFSLK
ncbi:GNAT family N-acetyltransferase [Roseivirga sp. BDSF3-8]|uniref:GNAT family N-acetyltransferase n=1 Tax=Roseivirga sp. BDSF3-8 TaxID=3241598 RepID=UPI0035326D09